MRLWSKDPSLPALHAACERQQLLQQQQQKQNSSVPITAPEFSLTSGSSPTLDSGIANAVTMALRQLQEQHATASVNAGGSNSANGAGPAHAARLASLRKCLAVSAVDSVLPPNTSTNPMSTATSRSDEANLVSVVPACLGAVFFRQQQVEVRSRAAGAGDARATALEGSSSSTGAAAAAGAGALPAGCGGDDGPAGGGGGSRSWLLLRPGVAFELQVQLYDSFGAPVRAGGGARSLHDVGAGGGARSLHSARAVWGARG